MQNNIYMRNRNSCAVLPPFPNAWKIGKFLHGFLCFDRDQFQANEYNHRGKRRVT